MSKVGVKSANKKRCTGCKKLLPLGNFYARAGSKSRRSRCRPCDRASRSRNAELERINKLRLRYGLTPADYDELAKKQNWMCGICNTPAKTLSYKLYIDHCHDSSEVRGLLCRKCNFGLGYFDDQIRNLVNAIKYLERSRSREG